MVDHNENKQEIDLCDDCEDAIIATREEKLANAKAYTIVFVGTGVGLTPLAYTCLQFIALMYDKTMPPMPAEFIWISCGAIVSIIAFGFKGFKLKQ